MPEVLSELVAKISVEASDLKKGLSDAEKQTETSSARMADSLKKVSLAFVAIGGAITAAMGLMGKAAIDEGIGIERLRVALKGVGVNYDNVKNSLEAVIAATEQKTGISDNEQREVLGKLILVTKDYDKALSLLPLALDLAAASGMDARSAAVYLSKAYEELEAGADKIGIRMGTTMVYFKDLNEVQQLVGGTAKATVNPFNQLKNSMSNLAEELGANLIPLIKDAVGVIVAISNRIQSWAKNNPELTKTLILVTSAIGGVLLVVGTLGLTIPPVVAGVKALTVVFGALNLATIGYTVVALAAVAAVYGIINVIRSLKGEAYVGTSFGDTVFGQIKQDLNSLNAKIKEFLPTMDSLTDSTEQSTVKVKSLADAYDPELVKAQEKVIRSSQKLQDEQHELNLRFNDLLLQVYYNESAASKYGLTIDDVYQAMFRLGFKTEDIRKGFLMFGRDSNYTQMLLSEFGLTAEQVAGVLGKLKDTTDKNAESFKKMGDAAKEAADKALQAAAATVPGGGFVTPWGVIIGRGERALGPGDVGNRQEYIGGQGLTGRKFASGGVVTQPTMGLIGEAGPEAVIPLNEAGSMGGITVNFTQPVFFDREDTMNRFVDMISKGIDRKQRLRFGGAYSG